MGAPSRLPAELLRRLYAPALASPGTRRPGGVPFPSAPWISLVVPELNILMALAGVELNGAEG